MEFTINTTKLIKTLNTLQNIIQKKSILNILSNVLIQTNKNNKEIILFTTTNLDIEINIYNLCSIIKPGVITIPIKALTNIAKLLPGPNTHFICDPIHNDIKIHNGRTIATLKTTSAIEYPKSTIISNIIFNKVNINLFAKTIQKTLHAVSKNKNRHNLTGVLIKQSSKNKNIIDFVATDSHRLCKIQEYFTNFSFNNIKHVIIPKKGIIEVLRVLEYGKTLNNEFFKLGFINNFVIIKINNATLIIKLINEKFPKYEQVIPKLADKNFKISKFQFLISLKRVSAWIDNQNQNLKIFLQRKKLLLSCYHTEVGEICDNISILYNGPNINIKLSPIYLIEALLSFSDHNVEVNIIDSFSPILIKGIDNQNHQCIIMPMRI